MNQSPYSDDRGSWNDILPDGAAFNHWSGKSVTEQLLRLLDLTSTSVVLDVCCGEGGTLMALPQVGRKVGIDLSAASVARCQANVPDAELIVGDARCLPFGSGIFDRAYSQDADVWMSGSPESILREIRRVLATDGRFVLQNYARSRTQKHTQRLATDAVLRSHGFSHTAMLVVEDVPYMLEASGFVVETFVDLHEVYCRDNLRMLERARETNNSLLSLFEWEKEQFDNHWWTGFMVVGRTVA